MTKIQNHIWTEKLKALEARVSDLKNEAYREFSQPVGSHALVSALAAIESMVWATEDAISRFPTDEQIEKPESC